MSIEIPRHLHPIFEASLASLLSISNLVLPFLTLPFMIKSPFFFVKKFKFSVIWKPSFSAPRTSNATCCQVNNVWHSWKVLYGVCCVVTHITGYNCIVFCIEKLIWRWTEARLWYGSESEIPWPGRQSTDPEEPSQRVITLILHTHLWKGHTGVTTRRLSKNGRKNYMEGQREGEKVDTKRADKVCWVLPVYPIIHSLLIILLCAGGIQPQRSPVLWLLVRISLGEIWREGEYKEGGKWSQSISLQPDHLWLPESSAEGCGSSQAALSTVPQCWVPVECPS